MTMRTILLFVASTGTALAAGGGDGGFPAKELLFHAINLAIVIGILVKFAGPSSTPEGTHRILGNRT